VGEALSVGVAASVDPVVESLADDVVAESPVDAADPESVVVVDSLGDDAVSEVLGDDDVPDSVVVDGGVSDSLVDDVAAA